MLRMANVVRTLPVMMFLGVLLLGAGDALARTTEKSWEVGGYYAFGRFSNNANIGGENLFGVRGAYAFREAGQVEVDFDKGGAPHQESDDIDFDITKFGVSYRHLFFLKGHEKIVPAFIVGLGSVAIDDGENSMRANFFRTGGGFSYYYTDRLSFRFDVRLFRFHGDNEIGARPPVPGPEVIGMPSKGMFAFDTVLGLSYLFGGGK